MTNTRRRRHWLAKHTADPYVKLAQRDGFRSRAAYKLLALHEKEKLFFPGQKVLDLGAAPGAWSQLAAQYVKPHGEIVAVDRLFMDPLNQVHFIQGDLEEDETLTQLYSQVLPQGVDLVMSDIAPNLSGFSAIDQPRILYLIELALEIAEKVLKPKGHFLVKCFHGAGFDAYFKKLRTGFDKVSAKKPAASRSNSSEVYLLARGYRGTQFFEE